LSKFDLTYKSFGTSAILVEWPAKIDESILRDILACEGSIEKDRNIQDTIIAYNSLTLRYTNAIDFDSEVSRLKGIYKAEKKSEEMSSKTWFIPVCYDQDFGLDLEEIASAKNLTINEVIKLHSSPEYLVYFIGFQPGFLYLGGLNEKLHMPRKGSPRLRVAKGSVGIGGEQTGVYPNESAGGWNILGRSPIDFFDVNKSEPCFAKPGDRIRFEPIDRAEFERIEVAVQEGSYPIKFRSL
jgi:inhibitor of KinA